jgi:hypothetical protein
MKQFFCLAIKLKSEKFKERTSDKIDLSEVKISSIIFSEIELIIYIFGKRIIVAISTNKIANWKN